MRAWRTSGPGGHDPEIAVRRFDKLSRLRRFGVVGQNKKRQTHSIGCAWRGAFRGLLRRPANVQATGRVPRRPVADRAGTMRPDIYAALTHRERMTWQSCTSPPAFIGITEYRRAATLAPFRWHVFEGRLKSGERVLFLGRRHPLRDGHVITSVLVGELATKAVVENMTE